MIWNFIFGTALVILAICCFIFVNPHIPHYEVSGNTGPVATSTLNYFPIIFEIGLLVVGVAIIYVSCMPVIMWDGIQYK